MIYPIVVYGDPVLKKPAEEVKKDHPELQTLIADMYETMYAAGGIGLAAPQIDKSLRLFVVDGTPMSDEDPALKDFKKVFINPVIISEGGEHWGFEEGCLSIPGLRERIDRHATVLLRYQDENFNEYEEQFQGLAARIIQHEYDHIEGLLFTDRLSPFKKSLLKGKLNA
ncbi:MAG: peptide deformylase, partial [Bacteroidota bacterium]|nr:peptide deformylase [Bacteroidota bacterium]